MSKSVILVEEIDKFRYRSEIQVKDIISSSTKRNWHSLSEFHPSEVVVFKFTLTRSSEIIDSVVFSDRKPVIVHRSELFDGVDTLMHKVVEVTKEALRSMRAPDEYLPDTIAKIFDVVRYLARHMNHRNEVSVNVDINYCQLIDHGDDDNRVSGQGSMSMNFGWGSLMEPLDNDDGVFKVSGFANPNDATKSAIEKLEKETCKFMMCYL